MTDPTSGPTSGLVGPDATAVAEAIRAGEVSAREVVEASIAAIEKHDPVLNTVVGQRFEEALAEVDAGLPDGPFTGVPMLVKDLGTQVAGLPHTRGSRLFADDVSAADSELVRRYKAAGLVVLGTSNTPELGKNASTEPLLHGPTRNPWSTAHSTGGSSGGSAAAVAAGLVPVAHGNDGGGSIRIPASACGLFGLKPSRGRVSSYPFATTLSQPLSINHVVARSVRDSALLLDLTAGPLPGEALTPPVDGSFLEHSRRDPGRLRIGLVTARADGGLTDEVCADAARSAARLCESLGHEVVETTFGYDVERAMSGFATLMGADLLAGVRARLAALGRDLADDDLEPFTAMLWDYYQSLGPADVVDALRSLQETGWEFGRHFAPGGYDVLLSPTLALPVPELGVLDTSRPETMWERGADYSAYTNIANITGQPGMSVPWGLDASGLPLGVQFLADYGREDLLLSLATQLELASPWPARAPGY